MRKIMKLFSIIGLASAEDSCRTKVLRKADIKTEFTYPFNVLEPQSKVIQGW